MVDYLVLLCSPPDARPGSIRPERYARADLCSGGRAGGRAGGASTPAILRLLTTSSVRLVLVGSGLGLALSAAMSQGVSNGCRRSVARRRRICPRIQEWRSRTYADGYTLWGAKTRLRSDRSAVQPVLPSSSVGDLYATPYRQRHLYPI